MHLKGIRPASVMHITISVVSVADQDARNRIVAIPRKNSREKLKKIKVREHNWLAGPGTAWYDREG